MDARELRLGNWVLDASNTPIRVTPQRIADIDNNLVVSKPIPLTEEILLKCWFEISYSSNFRLKFDHTIHNEIGYDYSHVADKSMEGFRYYGHYIKCEYLHQLQNLYFALTGQELEINL